MDVSGKDDSGRERLAAPIGVLLTQICTRNVRSLSGVERSQRPRRRTSPTGLRPSGLLLGGGVLVGRRRERRAQGVIAAVHVDDLAGHAAREA